MQAPPPSFRPQRFIQSLAFRSPNGASSAVTSALYPNDQQCSPLWPSRAERFGLANGAGLFLPPFEYPHGTRHDGMADFPSLQARDRLPPIKYRFDGERF